MKSKTTSSAISSFFHQRQACLLPSCHYTTRRSHLPHHQTTGVSTNPGRIGYVHIHTHTHTQARISNMKIEKKFFTHSSADFRNRIQIVIEWVIVCNHGNTPVARQALETVPALTHTWWKKHAVSQRILSTGRGNSNLYWPQTQGQLCMFHCLLQINLKQCLGLLLTRWYL